MSQDLDSLKMTKGSAGFAAGLLLVFDPSDASPSVIGPSVALRFFSCPGSRRTAFSLQKAVCGVQKVPLKLSRKLVYQTASLAAIHIPAERVFGFNPVNPFDVSEST